ncbi:Cobalt-precorrin-5A hydrolase [Pelotomaculum propionicicum]|uniref:Cobalt-precorrin-5A hydrolase n=2 Tax=Pelotomaculum propionicicum TaxID=258475 RepID=A0A4Y7RSU1_9FIRM|nr:Cobalt-precorrin-5A hydrolase [Pelotomaculum propionicicum]
MLVVALPGPGLTLAQTLAKSLDADLIVAQPGRTPGLSEIIKQVFDHSKALIMVMATGIATRTVGPLLRSKHTDPAVVVMDRYGRYAVSLAGGHEGGANQLACEVAALTGGEPVITTGTEAGRTAAVGVGYRRQATGRDIEYAVRTCLEKCGLSPDQVKFLSTALFKWHDHSIRQAAAGLGVLFRFFAAEQLARVEGVSAPSQAAIRHFSLKGVSEQCALLSLKNPQIILPRTIVGPVTVAVAREDYPLWASAPAAKMT